MNEKELWLLFDDEDAFSIKELKHIFSDRKVYTSAVWSKQWSKALRQYWDQPRVSTIGEKR